MSILLIEDKLGITAGYRGHWDRMLMKFGMNPDDFVHRNPYKAHALHGLPLLIQKGNRKSPGYNPNTIGALRSWVDALIQDLDPTAIVCMDVATLGIVEPSWDIATIDNCRGGVYKYQGIPFLITMPISAINTKKNPKDVRAMNEGAEDKDEWEEMERDPEELFIEPYTIPYGRWVLGADLQKLKRVVEGQR